MSGMNACNGPQTDGCRGMVVTVEYLMNQASITFQFYRIIFKAMDDIGVVMTPFGDVVTVILVVYSDLAC